MKTSEFFVGNRGVAIDQLREETAVRLDAEGQRRDVEQDHVLDVAAKDAALDGRADGDDFIGIDVAVRIFSEDLLDGFDDARHARLSADQHDFVDLIRGDAGGLAARR